MCPVPCSLPQRHVNAKLHPVTAMNSSTELESVQQWPVGSCKRGHCHLLHSMQGAACEPPSLPMHVSQPSWWRPACL